MLLVNFPYLIEISKKIGRKISILYSSHDDMPGLEKDEI